MAAAKATSTGQTADPGSPFVYGVRRRESGGWSFAAPIVGEKMPQVVLEGVPLWAIKTAFSFG